MSSENGTIFNLHISLQCFFGRLPIFTETHYVLKMCVSVKMCVSDKKVVTNMKRNTYDVFSYFDFFDINCCSFRKIPFENGFEKANILQRTKTFSSGTS